MIFHKNYIPAAFALDPSRRTDFKIRIIDPATPHNRCTAAIATTSVITDLLIKFFSKISLNQTVKLKNVKKKITRLLRKFALKSEESDVITIFHKLDRLCTLYNLADQESWSTYLSFCLAILDDELSAIHKDYKDQLFEIIRDLRSVHEYMEKKEGREITQVFSEKAADIYEYWRKEF